MTYTGQLVTGSVVLLIYLMVMLFAASNYIRRANGGWLEAHEAALRGRMRAGKGTEPTEIDAAIKLLLRNDKPERTEFGNALKARGSARPSGSGPARSPAGCACTRPSDWRSYCCPTPRCTGLLARWGQIEELPAVRQSFGSDGGELQNCPVAAAESAAIWKAELSQLLAELFNARDSTYNQLVSLYGKAGWLVTAAYLPVAALLVSGYGPVLLAGFLGGLVSRMAELAYGRPIPFRSSRSPVPAPAWAGLHLLVLMQGLGVVDLKGVLPPDTDFRLVVQPSVIGLSVLLGFSERLQPARRPGTRFCPASRTRARPQPPAASTSPPRSRGGGGGRGLRPEPRALPHRAARNGPAVQTAGADQQWRRQSLGCGDHRRVMTAEAIGRRMEATVLRNGALVDVLIVAEELRA